jgi:dienelactone hydrolase
VIPATDGRRTVLWPLIATQVLILLLTGCVVSAAPVASWSFNEDSGAVVKDQGPGGHDGRSRAVEYVVGAGNEGQAVRFADASARIDVPPASGLAFNDQKSFTLTLWIRAAGPRGFATILMTKDKPGGTVSYSLTLGREPGKLSFELWSWQTVRLLSRDPITDGNWHFVTAAYDAATNTGYLFVDDILQGRAKIGKGGPEQVLLSLGNNLDADQPFAGEIDDVVIEAGLSEDAQKMIRGAERWTLLTQDEIRKAQQAYLDRMAAPRFHTSDTAEDWQEHAAQVRRHVLECLGLWPLPERVPLDLREGGSLEHETYTLKRVYWQTWPGYWASGYLYLPKQAKFPVPGILCPHGHWQNGARHPVVQSRCISLAMKGYVVLAVDSVHAYDWAVGMVPMTLMAWNNLRGIDLLCSLPQVDPERLGVTGCSGGGQQTFYLMALDDGLDVAIPVCMVSEWRRILAIDSHHCRCNHVPAILTGTDTPELAACFAPRPSLDICVTQDWTRWLPTEGFPQIKRVYELFGAGDKVKCTQYDWGHDYSLPMREEAYGYFNRYLLGIDDPKAALEPAHETESLETLATLDRPVEEAKGPEVVREDLLRRTTAKLPTTGDTRPSLQSLRQGFLALLHEDAVADSPAAREVGETLDVSGYAVDRVIVTSEQEIPVPAVVLRNPDVGSEGTRRPAVLLVDPAGKTELLTARWKLITALADRGLVVCLADPRPYGELGLNRPAQEMNGTVFGRPELAVAAHDLVCVAQYLRNRPDVREDGVMCVGWGETAVAALTTGLFDPALARVVALDLGPNYLQEDRLPRAPRILTVGDLPQLAALLAPRPLWVQGVSDAESFAWTARAYADQEAPGAFLLSVPQVADAELVAWLASGW